LLESKRLSTEYYSHITYLRKEASKALLDKGNDVTCPDIISNSKEDSVTNNVKFTIKDLELLSLINQLKYDTRSYVQYFTDCLGQEHIILNIFMKKSLILPVNYRVIQGIALTGIMFFLNALLYTDESIKQTSKLENEGVILK